jgi:hypothetical protein
MMRIARKGGKITMDLEIKSFDGSTLVLGGVFSSGIEAREGIDTLVVSRGSKANDSLYKALKGRVKELYESDRLWRRGRCSSQRWTVFASAGWCEQSADLVD